MPGNISLIGSVAFEIFFMYSSYLVISVLNALVLRSIQYLRLSVYVFVG